MDEFKVSIIMLVYNHEATVDRALQSILEQEHNHKIELIISDDCSTDNSSSSIDKFLQSHSISHIEVIRIRHEKNIGIGRNWAECNKMARGKYIAVCDGDDYWTDPLKLQSQVELLESDENIGLVCGDVNLINEKDDLIELSRVIESGRFNIGDLRRRKFVSTSTAMFCNGVIEFNEDWEKLIMQDYIGWEMILSAGYYGFYMNRKLAVQRVLSTGSYSTKSKSEKQKMYIAALEYLVGNSTIADRNYLKKRLVFSYYKLSKEIGLDIEERKSLLRKSILNYSLLVSPFTKFNALKDLARLTF